MRVCVCCVCDKPAVTLHCLLELESEAMTNACVNILYIESGLRVSVRFDVINKRNCLYHRTSTFGSIDFLIVSK